MKRSAKLFLLKIYNFLLPPESKRRINFYHNFLYRFFPDKIDQILSRYFAETTTPTFMVIGAYDGIYMDRIYKYIKRYESTGILVEPMPELFEQLKSNYSRLKRGEFFFENVAVSDKVEERDFYFFEDGEHGDLDLFGSLSHDHLMRIKIEHFERKIAKRRFKCMTVNEIVVKHGLTPEVIIVDAEGYDDKIIKSLDFSAYKPKIIVFEHVNLSNEGAASSVAYLTINGYRVAKEVVDYVAVR